MGAVLVLLVIGATFRLVRLLTTDVVFARFRAWVARRYGEESKAAYFVECPWCTSMYLALGPALAAVWWPDNRGVLFVLLALTASASAGLIATRIDTE